MLVVAQLLVSTTALTANLRPIVFTTPEWFKHTQIYLAESIMKDYPDTQVILAMDNLKRAEGICEYFREENKWDAERMLPVFVDFEDEESITKCVEEISGLTGGKIYGLCHCAHRWNYVDDPNNDTKVLDLRTDGWLKRNFYSTVNMNNAFLPLLKAYGPGSRLMNIVDSPFPRGEDLRQYMDEELEAEIKEKPGNWELMGARPPHYKPEHVNIFADPKSTTMDDLMAAAASYKGWDPQLNNTELGEPNEDAFNEAIEYHCKALSQGLVRSYTYHLAQAHPEVCISSVSSFDRFDTMGLDDADNIGMPKAKYNDGYRFALLENKILDNENGLFYGTDGVPSPFDEFRDADPREEFGDGGGVAPPPTGGGPPPDMGGPPPPPPAL